MPVSTTQVLSSGFAGTRWASNSGVQVDTIRKMNLVWGTTRPAAILLATAFDIAGGSLIAVAHPWPVRVPTGASQSRLP
jgi:phosphate/sulfate permease